MRRMLLGLLFLFTGWQVPERIAPVPAELPPQALRLGMSPAEVRGLLPAPRHVARQVLYQRVHEQWHYDHAEIAWLEFDCRRGQTPRLLTVQARKPQDR